MKFQLRKELEEDLEGELDLSGVEGSADSSEKGAGKEWLRSWQEVYAIEEIEEFAAQLDREPLRNRYVLEDREVYVCESGSPEGIPADCPVPAQDRGKSFSREESRDAAGIKRLDASQTAFSGEGSPTRGGGRRCLSETPIERFLPDFCRRSRWADPGAGPRIQKSRRFQACRESRPRRVCPIAGRRLC